MSPKRRWILAAVTLVSGMLLVTTRVLGFMTNLGMRRGVTFGSYTGLNGGFGWFAYAPLRATVGISVVRSGGSDWGESILLAAVVLAVLVLAVYFALGGLDPRRGAVSAFVVGWSAMTLAAVAGEAARVLVEGNASFSVAPLTHYIVPTYSVAAAGYGLVLGWIVGLAVAITFARTRPRAVEP